MAAGFSIVNVFNKWLDVIRTGGSAFSATTTVYVQLHTGEPGASGTANVSVGSTTRVAVTQSTPASAAMAINGTNPAWTNGGTSETITHISHWTAASAGSFLYSVAVTASKAWGTGDGLTLTSDSVTLTPAAA